MNTNPGIIASIPKLPMTTAIPRVPHIRIDSIIRIRNGMIFSTLQVNSPAVRRTAYSPPKLRFSCMILSRISIQEQTTNTALTKNVCQVCCSNRFHARLVSVLTLAAKFYFRSYALTCSTVPLFVNRKATFVMTIA